MLELEEQLADYGGFLDTLDSDAAVTLTTRRRERFRRRSLVLIAACVAALAVTGIWLATRHDSSPDARVSPAASTTIPITSNPVSESTFVSSTPSAIVLRYPSGLWRVKITKETQFCRAEKGCAAARTDLRPGDRIDVARPDNRPMQVSANGVVTTAQLEAINGDTLTVHDVRHPEQPNPSYTLILRPDTIYMAGTTNLQIGDSIYYTGWAASPEGAATSQSAKPGTDTTVYAARVFPNKVASASAPEQPLAPVPDIIGTCPPEQPLPATASTEVPREAKQAAIKYALTTLQWPSVQVFRAYHVGLGDTGYESMYRTQISQSCGSAVADASFGVDLSNPDGDSSTDSRAALVVAQFPDGWHVWARFNN